MLYSGKRKEVEIEQDSNKMSGMVLKLDINVAVFKAPVKGEFCIIMKLDLNTRNKYIKRPFLIEQ